VTLVRRLPEKESDPSVVQIVVPGSDIIRSSVSVATTRDQQGASVNFSLNSRGTAMWSTWTIRNVNQLAPVVLDGRVIVDPFIEDPIPGGQMEITVFHKAQAAQLAAFLTYGPLPAPLRFIRSCTTLHGTTKRLSGSGHC